jgi:hypothetical protein
MGHCRPRNRFQVSRWPTVLLLGHTKLDSTLRYLGIEVDEVISISEYPNAAG